MRDLITSQTWNCDCLWFTFFLLPASDVKVYDPSGDSTLPSVSKKRKIEEVEEGDEEEEKPVQAKAKKVKQEPPAEGKHPYSRTLSWLLLLTLVKCKWTSNEY